MQPLYRLFAGDSELYDFSEESALEQYVYESKGECSRSGGPLSKDERGLFNGYSVGKHNLDLSLTEWNRDLNSRPPLLYLCELYEDPELKDYRWWLKKVLKPPEWMQTFYEEHSRDRNKS